MTEQEIRERKPSGATGYIIGRITGEVIYVKDNMVWSFAAKDWTSFVHNMNIKPL